MRFILASQSEIRAQLLRNAGLAIETRPARIDEAALRQGMEAEGAPPRDIAGALAEAKARKISSREPEALVLGCDQVLELDGRVLAKPGTAAEARAQLGALSGRAHQLHSAAAAALNGAPIWRHVGKARLTMHVLSPSYMDDYVARNWPGIADSVGAYKLEEEGARLMAKIEGDHFTILGLPMLPLLDWLAARGDIAR